jgi:ketosteroid isomerase-like protein
MSSLKPGIVLFAAMLALAGPVPAHEPTAPTARTSVLPAVARPAAATVDSFHAALRRGDTAAAAALLTDDALIFEGGGVERSKAEYAAHHLPADAAFSREVTSTATRRSGNAAGNLAWVATEGRTTGTYKGKALKLVTTETVVLRRAGRSWKIVHIHWSSATKP